MLLWLLRFSTCTVAVVVWYDRVQVGGMVGYAVVATCRRVCGVWLVPWANLFSVRLGGVSLRWWAWSGKWRGEVSLVVAGAIGDG